MPDGFASCCPHPTRDQPEKAKDTPWNQSCRVSCFQLAQTHSCPGWPPRSRTRRTLPSIPREHPHSPACPWVSAKPTWWGPIPLLDLEQAPNKQPLRILIQMVFIYIQPGLQEPQEGLTFRYNAEANMPTVFTVLLFLEHKTQTSKFCHIFSIKVTLTTVALYLTQIITTFLSEGLYTYKLIFIGCLLCVRHR